MAARKNHTSIPPEKSMLNPVEMSTWDSAYGRPCQSAPSSRKTSPILKGTSRTMTPSTSPHRPMTSGSPRPSAGYCASHRRSQTPEIVCDNDSYDTSRHHHHHHLHHSDMDPCTSRGFDDPVKGDLKNFYDNLLKGKDDMVRKLEKKVECLQKEIACLKQAKEKELQCFRHAADYNSQMVEAEYQKRLNEALAESEKQKVCMHREHTRRVQEMLETTNRRLQKMEASYGDRISYLTRMVDDLECKLSTLCKEMEESTAKKQCLKEERDRLQSDLCCIHDQYQNLECQLKEACSELESSKDKICQLEIDKATLEETSRTASEDLRRHLECEIQRLKEKNEEDELQFKCKIASLEQTICSLKESLKKNQETFCQRLKETENKHSQTFQAMECQHKQEIQSLQNEMDNLVRDYSTQIKTLEVSLGEKERQLGNIKMQLQQQAREYEEKLKREKECLYKCEQDLQCSSTKIQELCDQLAETERTREQQVEEVCHKLEEQRKQLCEEIRDLHCKLQRAQRVNELQAEDATRHLEEEKRLCDEKVSKVSEQLNQSICLYEKEVNELSKQLENERCLRNEQVQELTSQLQQAKRLQIRQEEEFSCQLEEEKRNFRCQVQDLSGQVEQFRTMCEKQSMDYAKQLEEERRLRKEQLERLQCEFQVEKEDIQKRFQKEMDLQKRDPQNYIKCLEERCTKLLTEVEDKSWEQEQCYLKRINELEDEVQQLRCELAQCSSQSSLKRHTTASTGY